MFRLLFKKKKIKIKKINKEFLKNKELAKELVRNKLEYWTGYYKEKHNINFEYNRVAVRNQKTRWGSCSSRGNLNFNYRLALIDEELVDYVIIHELCHLIELNHGKNFWSLVELGCPDYKMKMQTLKNIRFSK